MKAIYFDDQSFSIRRMDRPQPKSGEALIRVYVTGICNTDIELFKGYYGFKGIPGHEFVGVVESCPDYPQWQGVRVVGDINIGCGECLHCLADDPRHCASRNVLGIVNHDGSFAEYITLPVKNLHEVPNDLSDEQAVFAEPLAAALEVAQQVHIHNQQKVLIMGDGKLGLLIALGLQVYNPHLILVGKHADKLAIARQQNVETHLWSEKFQKELAGHFDVVVEATGKESGLGQALSFVHPEGIVVAKTTSHKLAAVDMAKVVVDEIQIIGSRCGDLDLALSFMDRGWVRVEPLIEAILPFAQFEEGFALAQTPSSKKVLIKVSDGE